jgi:nucleoside-diphosphate-sugar epimerase
MENKGMKMALCGSDAMLRHYILQIFKEFAIVEDDVSGDCEVLVVADSFTTDSDGKSADSLSGRISLSEIITRCGNNPPKHILYVGSVSVYGRTEGEQLDENTGIRALTEKGKYYSKNERTLESFVKEKNITLTILRSVEMFGKGMSGDFAVMCDKVMRGIYLNIRDHSPRRSLVLAYDVARVAREVYAMGGIYNVSDGYDHTLPELAKSMGENLGRSKSVYTLPLKWAKLLAKIGDIIPFVGNILDSGSLHERTHTLTYSNGKVAGALPDGFSFIDTLRVLTRENKEYPYEDE